MSLDITSALNQIDTSNGWNSITGFNTNALDPTQFKITFTRLPNYVFFCQSIELPTVALPKANHATPYLDIEEIGDKIEFGNLVIQMILDSKLDNYKALYKWMFQLSNLGKGIAKESSALLTIGSTVIEFDSIWPTSMGSVLFTSTPDVVQYAISQVEFNYNFFHFPDEPNMIIK